MIYGDLMVMNGDLMVINGDLMVMNYPYQKLDPKIG